MIQSKDGQEIVNLMNIAEKLDPGQDLKAGEGSVKQDIKRAAREQQYTRDEIAKMAEYIRKFVSSNAQQSSWGKGEALLNKVGSEMSSFITQVQTAMAKDPAIDGVTNGTDMMDKNYNPNSYQKGSKTQGNDYN
jgi:hypothetical protein